MEPNVRVTRYKKSATSGRLYDGRKFGGRAAFLPGTAASGVGAALLTTGSNLVERYGSGGIPIAGSGGLFVHVAAIKKTAGDYNCRIFISNGSACDSAADPSLRDKIHEYLNKLSINSAVVKRITDSQMASLNTRLTVETGNYIKLFDEAMIEEKYVDWYTKPENFYGVLFTSAVASFQTIGSFRDCSLWYYPAVSDVIQLSWKNAYNADTHEEVLHLLDDQGHLVSEIRIDRTEVDGSRNLPLEGGKVYQLVVPGYSYRNYFVRQDAEIKWQLEPAKLQFSSFLSGATTLYFIVKAGELANFCMKDYNSGGVTGPYAAKLTRMQDDLVINVTLPTKDYYYEHESVPLPVVVEQDQWWKMELQGDGRTAIWLDGIPNIFSERISWYTRPTYNPGSVTAVATPGPVHLGFMPNIGFYLPYGMPNPDALPQLAALGPQVACFYSLVNIMAVNPHREDALRQLYAQTMGITRDYTILARDGRDAITGHGAEAKAGIDAFIANLARINDGGVHYLSIADEPNYNYESYEKFSESFAILGEYINAHPQKAAARVKLALPASSRFDHGPNGDGAQQRLGRDWAVKLLAEYPDIEVNAIVWHDWTARSLLNLRQYTKTVEAAYLLSNGGERTLCIEQTNTAGGQSVSLYDQNTHYAVQWWASVIINTARTGKLNDLMWFPIVDELTHPKGLMFTLDEDAGIYAFKPVAYFVQAMMTYLTGTTNTRVYELFYPGIEVDMLYFSADKAGVRKYTVMGVSKVARYYSIRLQKLGWPDGVAELKFFKPGMTVLEDATYTTIAGPDGGEIRFVLPPDAVFYLSRSVTL